MAKARSKSPAKAAAAQASGGKGMLDTAVGLIEQTFGQGSIMKLSDSTDAAGIAGISTGALSLDLALGGKGFPRGRIIELYGPESSGKTTLALHPIASAQQAGGTAAFVAAEHALDTAGDRQMGVHLAGLLVSTAANG